MNAFYTRLANDVRLADGPVAAIVLRALVYRCLKKPCYANYIRFHYHNEYKSNECDIWACFTFAKTDQGVDYWFNIAQKLAKFRGYTE